MEIFFLNKITFLTYFIIFVFSLLVFAQGCILINKTGAEDASMRLNENTKEVFLGIDEGSFEGVKLYVNGEEWGEFGSTLLKAYIPEASVIQIYNPNETPITLILNSPYTVCECQKGMNNIN